jgi:hypothetical protein
VKFLQISHQIVSNWSEKQGINSHPGVTKGLFSSMGFNPDGIIDISRNL